MRCYLIVENMIRQSSLAPWALHCGTARLKVRSAVARCCTQADGGTVRSVVAVGSEMRRRRFTGCVAVRSVEKCYPAVLQAPVHSGIVMYVKRRYSLLDCHRQPYYCVSRGQITPCSIGAGCPFLMYRDWLALLDVSSSLVLLGVLALTGPSRCIEQPSPSWCFGADWSF